MCSTTRGPAIWPSLVTWPMRITAEPLRLAKRTSSWAQARTCPTVPGADSSVSDHSVWIESMTTSAGGASASRVARICARLVSVGDCDRGVVEAQALRAQTELGQGLFAGNVSHGIAFARERGSRLEHQRRLADARIAAHQRHRARHESAAHDAVEFGDTRHAARGVRGGAAQRLQRERGRLARPSRCRGSGRGFLGDAVPGAARVAASRPARRYRPAGLADECRARARQV